MSRITKDIAQEVAEKMVAPAREVVAEAYKKLGDAMTVIALNRVPEAIKETFKNHPEYFDTVQRVFLDGNGFNWVEVYLTERIVSSGGNSSITIQPTDAEHKILWDLHIDYSKKDKECKDLKRTISDTLYGLKTYAQVGKNFEEAVPFLPEKTSTELSVPIDNIREKLNFYASKTEQTTTE